MSFKDELKEEFKNFPSEIRQRFIDERGAELNEAFNNGRQICLLKTLDLLVDSTLNEEEIIRLLQKHFDLRLSETKKLIRTAKNRKARDKR